MPALPATPLTPRTLPLVIVMPEMVAVLPEATLKTRLALLPLTVSVAAPGPVIVMFLLIVNSPVVSVIDVTEGSKVIGPPAHTPLSIASRKVSAPLSALPVTTTDEEHASTTFQTGLELCP